MTAGHYHCSVNPVGRGKSASAMHKAAYRAGEQLYDERAARWTVDYGRRARSVVEKFILTRPDAAMWQHDRQRLWNAAEAAEARRNGRIATELELGLPHELDPARRRRLLLDFLAPIIARYGVAADIAIHTAHDCRNLHAHVLLTHRQLGPDGFGEIANARTITKKIRGREKQIGIAGVTATPADMRRSANLGLMPSTAPMPKPDWISASITAATSGATSRRCRGSIWAPPPRAWNGGSRDRASADRPTARLPNTTTAAAGSGGFAPRPES